MANNKLQLIMSFNRAISGGLPKTVNGTVSKYTVGKTASTISPSVVEAVEGWWHMKNETDPGEIPGGVGTLSGASVAELLTPDGKVHMIVKGSDGKLQGAICDSFTGTLAAYSLGTKADYDATAVVLALMPDLMADDEFKTAYELYEQNMVDGDQPIIAMAMMSDNAYRRLLDPSGPAGINVNLASVNLSRLKKQQVESGMFKPDTVLVGSTANFGGDPSVNSAAKILVETDDFAGKYMFRERDLTADEVKLVPTLPSWYVVSQSAITVCQHAAAALQGFRMRNFLMRGPAGTGKTEDAKACAAGVALPYISETCNPATEIFDIIGQVVPDTGDACEAPGGKLSFSWDDLLFAPEMVYENVTGQAGENKSIELFAAALAKQIGSAAKAAVSGTKFKYVESGLVKALKYGWVCEIREPSVITNQGVLVGLNSILEQDGEIVMPVTGERFIRHPDAVVVMTTNSDYEGCRAMNQSVVDRMDLVLDVIEPSKAVMVQRAMSRTGEEDDDLVTEMVDIVTSVKEKLRDLGDNSGEAGMRSLISWILSTRITKNAYRSALLTVFAKATTDAETREMLVSQTLDISTFATMAKSA